MAAPSSLADPWFPHRNSTSFKEHARIAAHGAMMSAPQHSWQARCAAKRDEIERDTRMLDERKKNRIERLYRELEATNEALVPVEATTARAEGDRDRVVDGKLDLRDRMMRELVIPRSVEQCLETRSLRTLVLRGNRLRVLDARTLAPLVSLVSLDVSRNELERLGPTGAVTVHSDDAARYAAHPSLRRISALPPSSGTAPAVGGFPPGLETLCAAYNRIARLSFGPGGAPRLLRVSVAHNCVKFVAKDVDKAPLLEELDLRDNHLPTAQLRHLAPLRRVKRLLLAGNPLSDDRRHSHGLPAHLRGALNAPRLPRAPPVPSRPPPETLRPDPARGAAAAPPPPAVVEERRCEEEAEIVYTRIPLTKSFHASTCCDVCAEEPGCRFFQSDGDHCYTAPALSGADAVFFRTGAVDDRLRTFRMDGGNELCDACACGASVDCAGRGLVAVPDGAFDAASVDLSENPELVVLRLDGRFDGTTVNVGGTNAQYLDVGDTQRLATAPALAVALTGDADLPDKLINVATRRSRFTNACCSRKATNMTVNGDEAFLCRVGERVSPYQGSRAEVWPDLFDDGAAPADAATGADALYAPNVNYVDGLDAKWILKKITPDTPFLGAAATSAAACAEWCHLIRDCDYFTHDARNDGVCWTFGDVAATVSADAPDGFMSGVMPRAPVLLRATFALKIGARPTRGAVWASPAIAADFPLPDGAAVFDPPVVVWYADDDDWAAPRAVELVVDYAAYVGAHAAQPPGPDFGPLDGVFDVSYAVEACDAAFDGEDVDVEVDFGGLAFGCGAGTEEAADGACRDCGAGFFSNALTRCEPCPPGTHAKASGAPACVACDGTSYQPDWGKAACVQCPANTERPDDTDGSSINDCACKPGACNFATCATAAPFPPCDPVRQAADGVSTEVWDCADPTPGTGAYVTTRETGVACLECPKGGICLGGTALPFPEKGFGGRCREHGRCKRNFECARGFDDLLCTDVDTREDYFGIGGFPVRCGFRKGASRSRKIAASIAAIVGVGVVWLWINFGIQAYSALNIFFANLRVFFVVSKMNVEWPPVLIGWYAFFQMSQFDVDLVEPTCLGFRWTLTEKLGVQICLVAVLCLFYFGVAALKGG
ncbi:Exonuclease, partial [Aureococcus anophagefferens]